MPHLPLLAGRCPGCCQRSKDAGYVPATLGTGLSVLQGSPWKLAHECSHIWKSLAVAIASLNRVFTFPPCEAVQFPTLCFYFFLPVGWAQGQPAGQLNEDVAMGDGSELRPASASHRPLPAGPRGCQEPSRPPLPVTAGRVLHQRSWKRHHPLGHSRSLMCF